ncbi:MAG: hypothetical protein GY779_15865 [Gammaproteobacteria bacterium]|nr:hypothetical protein [Gammaproteobacteria bacterium]
MDCFIYSALNYLRQHPSIDTEKIGIVDMSINGHIGLSVIDADGAQSFFNYVFTAAVIFKPFCREYTPPYITPVLMVYNAQKNAEEEKYCTFHINTIVYIDGSTIVEHRSAPTGTAIDASTLTALKQFLSEQMNPF